MVSCSVGASVCVWISPLRAYVHAKVVEVNGDHVTVAWRDPRTGATMQKAMHLESSHLQWPREVPHAPATRALHPHRYYAGAPIEVWSNSQQSWLPGTIHTTDPEAGLVRVLLTLPSGDTRTNELPIGHVHLRPRARTVCREGIKCQQREEAAHLAEQAHPFDPDYASACRALGMQPVQPSLHGLFEWIDVDSSGKVSREELERALPLLSNLTHHPLKLSDEAWKQLDDDGNGAVNFSEFASWGGPRIGLPLGVEHLFSSNGGKEPGCGILGCTCQRFRPHREKLERLHRKLAGHPLREFFHQSLASAGMTHVADELKDRLFVCKCGHKKRAHVDIEQLRSRGSIMQTPVPSYWHSPGSEHVQFVQLDEQVCGLLQELFTRTYKNIWTRDRLRHQPPPHLVPSAFRVVRAFRCENYQSWQGYDIRRAELLHDRSEGGPDDDFQTFGDVLSAVTWDALTRHFTADRCLATSCNEWYLFHGTDPEAAQSICRTNIKLRLAGVHTGTLYGRGLYCAESITKADEYATPNEAGDHAVLLCRALGGRVLYTDEVEPDAEELVANCIQGSYDSVLGDRQKCRGTYREFVFFDAENIYPEYIIHYRRQE